MFVCHTLTVAPTSGVHDVVTTLIASRIGRPESPSEMSSRTRSVAVVHGPSVVDATSEHIVAGIANGSGYVALSVIAAVPPLAHWFGAASTFGSDASGCTVLLSPPHATNSAPYPMCWRNNRRSCMAGV